MLAPEIWLWIHAVNAAIVISACFSVLQLSGSPEQSDRALQMLPLELQFYSPPSVHSKILIGAASLAFVVFYAAIILLAIVWSFILAIFGGFILFYLKAKYQGIWIRDLSCRPMKAVIGWSAVLVITLILGVIDWIVA